MGVIMHNNITYGGGSSIEPNPQESATDQLETLGIDGDVYEVTDANAIHTSDVGVANGVAELDANGFVPSSQLPSYVDDVLEYASRSAFPATGETGKIYVALDTNLTYRWGGSDYVEISPSLALGETSSTAYRGDRGKIAYDHSQSDHSGIKPAFTEASTRANIASGETIATILGKIKKFFSDLKTVAFTGAYSDLSGTPTIPTVNDGTLTIKQNNTNIGTFTANQSTASNINIECAVPSDVEGSKVATGNPLTITDASPMKAEKIEIGLEPKQDKHGYNSVWVGGAGKNKIILTSAKIKQRNTSGTWTNNSYTWNGVTYALTVDSQDNVTNIALSGARSGESFLYLANQDDIYTYSTGIAGNQMTLNGCPANGGSDKYYLSTWISGSGTKSDYGSGVNATYPASFTQCNITLGITSGYTISETLNFRPMLRLASITDSSFAPYKNECPIQGYDIVSAYRCGKNLFDAQKTRGGAVSDGVIVIDDRADGWITTYDMVADSTTIYVKIQEKGTYSGSFYFKCFDENYTYLGDSDDIQVSQITVPYSRTLTLQTGTKFVRIVGWNSGGGATKIKTFKADVSFFNSAYEPFKGDSVLVQFGQTLYGGKLTILQDGSADVYCDRAGADLSNISFTRKTYTWPDVSGYYWESANVTGMKVSTETMSPNSKLLSDRYMPKGNYDLTGDSEIAIDSVNPRFIVTTIRTSSDTQPTGFTVYPLATPFTLHLSPVETLTLLQGINNVWTDGTTLSLTYQPDNAIGQAKGTAQELVDSASTWKLFAESPNANIALPTNCKELYICVIYTINSASDIMYDFHILPDILTKATSYFRQGDYYTPDYFSRCTIRIRKTSNVYDTRVEHFYMNNTTDRAENTTIKVYYR